MPLISRKRYSTVDSVSSRKLLSKRDIYKFLIVKQSFGLDRKSVGQQYLTILVFHRLTPAPSCSIRSLEMILYSDIPSFVYTNCRKHRVRQGEVAETKPVNTIKRNGDRRNSVVSWLSIYE